MEIWVLFFAASIVAGAANALAGGGGLITFPLLMLVVGPVTADATSAVALVAAYPAAVWRTRGELTDIVEHLWFWLLLITSVLGGLMGALLLIWTGDRNFVPLVPWIVLVATVIILLRPILVRNRGGHGIQPTFEVALWPVALSVIFFVSVYGGYFGAGIGILMIGALSFISPGDIRHVLALKNLLTGCMRGVAVVVLLLFGAKRVPEIGASNVMKSATQAPAARPVKRLVRGSFETASTTVMRMNVMRTSAPNARARPAGPGRVTAKRTAGCRTAAESSAPATRQPANAPTNWATA